MRLTFLKKSLDKDKDIPKEERYDHESHIDSLNEVFCLYHWWKNVYPLIEENDPWEKHYKEKPETFSLTDRIQPCEFDADGDPIMYKLVNNDSPEQQIANRKVLDESVKYNKEVQETVTENLIKLIKLRERLWT